MYFMIYKTTNLINGKFYVGYHSSAKVDDDYLGSGKILKEAIKKYGSANFYKEILYTFSTKQEALAKEKELVNEEFIKREDVYNIKCGGEGGWDHTWNDQKRIDGIRESFRNGNSIGWKLSSEQRSILGKKGFKDKKHSQETKEKIRKKLSTNTDVYQKRVRDYFEIDKKFGWKAELAKKWGVSHTQVKRFIDKFESSSDES